MPGGSTGQGAVEPRSISAGITTQQYRCVGFLSIERLNFGPALCLGLHGSSIAEVPSAAAAHLDAREHEVPVASGQVTIHASTMDFMKWLNSLDELLYEVMSWIIFFPLTLWRAGVKPLATMALIKRESDLPDDQRYASVLSPPLFLALSLLVAHAVSTALGQTDAIIANNHGLAALVSDNATALIVRVVVFAGFPLFLAARFVRSQGKMLDRVTLQSPFYEHCYPAAAFALSLSLSTSLSLVKDPVIHHSGQVLSVLSVCNFVAVETLWFSRQRETSYARSFVDVVVAMLQGLAMMVFAGFLLTR